jgi:hypothetical protein
LQVALLAGVVQMKMVGEVLVGTYQEQLLYYLVLFILQQLAVVGLLVLLLVVMDLILFYQGQV